MVFSTPKWQWPGPLLGGVLLSVILSSCGGGGGSSGGSDAAQPAALSGSIADFGVAGLSSSTPTVSGTTGARGSYSYRCTTTCEALTFKLGGITFGTATAAPTLTLRELQGGLEGGVLSEATIRRVQLLTSLDADAEPSNGITVPQEVAASLATRAIDFNANSFDADLEALLTFLRGDNRLSSSYRAGLRAPTRAIARALAEQFEALARGVFVETPTSANSVVEQIRKYVVRHPDALLVPYAGASSALKTNYPQGLRAAVGAGLTVASDSSAANIRLRVISSRGIAVTAPRFFDGTSARAASILLDSAASGGPSVGIIALSPTGAELTSLTAPSTRMPATKSWRFSPRARTSSAVELVPPPARRSATPAASSSLVGAASLKRTSWCACCTTALYSKGVRSVPPPRGKGAASSVSQLLAAAEGAEAALVLPRVRRSSRLRAPSSAGARLAASWVRGAFGAVVDVLELERFAMRARGRRARRTTWTRLRGFCRDETKIFVPERWLSDAFLPLQLWSFFRMGGI